MKRERESKRMRIEIKREIERRKERKKDGEREKFMLHRNRMIFHKTKLIKLNLVPRVSYNAPSFSQIFNLFSAGET